MKNTFWKYPRSIFILFSGKKGGGQKGNNCHRQTCTGTTGITVLMRDWVVVAGAVISGIQSRRVIELFITYAV
ncbi:hypothetical protein DA795_06810 [Klebsiella pneumoniae]|nr:hypothetical protein DA795_06810 [Klebsiella pneumoniae]